MGRGEGLVWVGALLREPLLELLSALCFVWEGTVLGDSNLKDLSRSE